MLRLGVVGAVRQRLAEVGERLVEAALLGQEGGQAGPGLGVRGRELECPLVSGLGLGGSAGRSERLGELCVSTISRRVVEDRRDPAVGVGGLRPAVERIILTRQQSCSLIPVICWSTENALH